MEKITLQEWHDRVLNDDQPWDMANFETCAVARLPRYHEDSLTHATVIAQYFGIDFNTARHIIYCSLYKPYTEDEITREMVASRIAQVIKGEDICSQEP